MGRKKRYSRLVKSPWRSVLLRHHRLRNRSTRRNEQAAAGSLSPCRWMRAAAWSARTRPAPLECPSWNGRPGGSPETTAAGGRRPIGAEIHPRGFRPMEPRAGLPISSMPGSESAPASSVAPVELDLDARDWERHQHATNPCVSRDGPACVHARALPALFYPHLRSSGSRATPSPSRRGDPRPRFSPEQPGLPCENKQIHRHHPGRGAASSRSQSPEPAPAMRPSTAKTRRGLRRSRSRSVTNTIKPLFCCWPNASACVPGRTPREKRSSLAPQAFWSRRCRWRPIAPCEVICGICGSAGGRCARPASD